MIPFHHYKIPYYINGKCLKKGWGKMEKCWELRINKAGRNKGLPRNAEVTGYCGHKRQPTVTNGYKGNRKGWFRYQSRGNIAMNQSANHSTEPRMRYLACLFMFPLLFQKPVIFYQFYLRWINFFNGRYM